MKKVNDKITLYNADCMEVMKQFKDKHFDLAIVDPDFGLNQKISQGGTWASKYKGFDGALGGKPTTIIVFLNSNDEKVSPVSSLQADKFSYARFAVVPLQRNLNKCSIISST